MNRLFPEVKKLIHRNRPVVTVLLLAGVFLILGGLAFENNRWLNFTSVALGTSLVVSIVTVLIQDAVTANKTTELLKLFSDYAEHGIFRTFENSSNHEYKEMHNEIFERAKDIRLLVLLGSAYVENKERRDRLKKRIKESDNFKMIILDPECEHYKIQYNEFEPRDEDIGIVGISKAEAIKENFNELIKFTDDLNEPEKKKLKYYDVKPVFALEFLDEHLFVAFYGLQSRGISSPIFMFQKRQNSKIYQYFENQFDNYFKTG